MCWPQDLYKVGDYDSDEGELWDDGSSEGSWETESEGSSVGEEEMIDQSIKPKLAANIEKARIAMSRLEELFTQNPALQTLDIMKKLLEIYKDCRYLDKLMGTSFFHENNFRGLLERVREKGRASVSSKVAEQVSRLFQNPSDNIPYKTGKDSEKMLVSYDLENEGAKTYDGGMLSVLPVTSVCLAATENKGVNINNLPEETKDVLDTAGIKESNKILVNNELNLEKSKKSLDLNGDITEDIERFNKTLASLSDTLDKKILEQNNKNMDRLEIESILKTKLLGSEKTNDEKSDGNAKSGISEDEFSNSTEKSPGSTNGQLIQSSSADDSGVFEHSTASADTGSYNDNCDCFSKSNQINNNSKQTNGNEGCESEKIILDAKKGVLIIGALGSRSFHSQPEKRSSGKLKFHAQQSFPLLTCEKDSQYDPNSNDCNPSQVCAKLCALIKSQLVKAHAEVTRRFQGDKAPVTLSEVDNENVPLEEQKTNDDGNATTTGQKEEKTDGKTNEEKPEMSEPLKTNNEGFSIMSNAPNSHKYKLTMCQMTDPKFFFKTVKKELTLLRTSLPPGIWVKGFEDRTVRKKFFFLN